MSTTTAAHSLNGEPSDRIGDDLVWGAEAIAFYIGDRPRRVYSMIEKGHIPAVRIGRRYCARKSQLRRFFLARLGEVA